MTNTHTNTNSKDKALVEDWIMELSTLVPLRLRQCGGMVVGNCKKPIHTSFFISKVNYVKNNWRQKVGGTGILISNRLPNATKYAQGSGIFISYMKYKSSSLKSGSEEQAIGHGSTQNKKFERSFLYACSERVKMLCRELWQSVVANNIDIQVQESTISVFSCKLISASAAMLLLAIVGIEPSLAVVSNEINMPKKGAVLLPSLPTEFPILKDPSLPKIEKILLPNGLRVFLLEDHELGLIGGQILVKGGGKYDPAEKVGLASMTSVIQRSGGTKEHPSIILDTELEETAARIETTSNVSQMSVGFRCLSEDLSKVMPLFSEVVLQPLMPDDKLELTRKQFLGAIQRRGDDAQGILAREFPKLLYGNDSIYARYATSSTIGSINRSDLLQFHKQIFRPNSSVLGIWGDFDASTVKKLIEQNFGSWTAEGDDELSASQPSALETGTSVREPCIFTVDRPGLSQGFVRLGELGTALADEDVFALDLLSDILNGFGGVLFDEVRSREGLAYSVYGGWNPAVEHRGAFLAGGETRLESIKQFVQAVNQVLERVIKEPPSEELVAEAKEGAVNSFIFNFVDSGSQLGRIMNYDLFGIDPDFLFNYRKRIEALTSQDILESARRHLHPGHQPILVVSDFSKIGSSLQSLGLKVVPLNLDYLKDQ